jgi:hypothetical protein
MAHYETASLTSRRSVRAPQTLMEKVRREAGVIALERGMRIDQLREGIKRTSDFVTRARLRRELIELFEKF